jgi:hypothetical protein
MTDQDRIYEDFASETIKSFLVEGNTGALFAYG